MKKWVLILLLAIPTISFAQTNQAWRIGLYSGYIIPQDYYAVGMDGGFPIGVFGGYTFKPNLHINLSYQRLQTVHDGGDDAVFQSVRLSPAYRFFEKDKLQLLGSLGVGYSNVDIKGIDKLNQMEILIGPQLIWNLKNTWDLRTNLNYVRDFLSLSESPGGQFEFSIGVSYGFHSREYYAQKKSEDADQDGVSDSDDECPTTPVSVKVKGNGCPANDDGDSVANYLDYCPDTKANVETDEMGCPLVHPARGYIENIEFEKGSPRLTTAARNELFRIAQSLKAYPNLSFVIEGYASPNEGAASQSISKARAVTVMNILVSYGIPADKITAVGFGANYTLSNNADAKNLNERIEIKWKQDLKFISDR